MLFQQIRLSLLEHHVWSFTNTNCLEFSVTRGKQALILSHLPSILKHMLYNHANKKKAIVIFTILYELFDENLEKK